MKGKILNEKKAQIGTIITWFVAFFIILFLMGGFLVITMALSGKEFFKKNEIILVENNIRNLENQRDLMVLLNVPLGEDKTIKKLVEEWKISYDEKIEKEIEVGVKKILEKEKCYLFRVDYDLDNSLEESIWVHKGWDFKKYSVESIGEKFLDISEEISKIIIFSDSQKINVELYVRR